jgi:hypothetical protein
MISPDDAGYEPRRIPAVGTCDECGASELAQYPVPSVGGWFPVVKCQACLWSRSREPWTRLGWIALAEDKW